MYMVFEGSKKSTLTTKAASRMISGNCDSFFIMGIFYEKGEITAEQSP